MGKVVMAEGKQLPKLTKAQADALENLKRLKNNNKHIIIKERMEGGWLSNKISPANDIYLDDLISALYIGYELKETLQEAITNRIDKIMTTCAFDHGYKTGFYSGVKFILDKMKIDPRKTEV